MDFPISLSASALAQFITKNEASHDAILQALIESNQIEKAVRLEKMIYLIGHPEFTEQQIYDELKGV